MLEALMSSSLAVTAALMAMQPTAASAASAQASGELLTSSSSNSDKDVCVSSAESACPFISMEELNEISRLAAAEVRRAPKGIEAVEQPLPEFFPELTSEGMTWRKVFDSVKGADVLYVASDTYSPSFVTYMARFLLNYDDTCAAWWRQQRLTTQAVADPSERTRILLKSFGEFSSSVEYGLRRYRGQAGVNNLLNVMIRRYGNRQIPESRRQLALLFSLLSQYQPINAITVLSRALPTRPTFAFSPSPAGIPSPVFASMKEEEGFFLSDPVALLPGGVNPIFDLELQRYRVSGLLADPKMLLSYQLRRDGSVNLDQPVLTLFGPRGPFPVTREKPLDWSTYALFATAGAFACSATHAAVIPLDVVKTKRQTDPERFDSMGLMQGAITLGKEEGWRMLLQGAQATILGYLWYGITVYPGYEFFKRLFASLAGPAGAIEFRVPLVLMAGAVATVFAAVGVCPCEAVRIRMVADPNYASGFLPAVQRLTREDGLLKLYDGFWPLLIRQVVFGMMKFFVFDSFAEFLFDVFPALDDTTAMSLSVSAFSGLVAGVASSIVSQPADTILSRINQRGGRESAFEVVRDIFDKWGPQGFFFGLGSRCVWAGSIIAGQFFLYDVLKASFGVRNEDLMLFMDVLSGLPQ